MVDVVGFLFGHITPNKCNGGLFPFLLYIAQGRYRICPQNDGGAIRFSYKCYAPARVVLPLLLK